MRITTQGLLRSSLRHIQNHFESLARNQEMLASGIRVKYPSDDPIATQRILRWRKVEEGISQYSRNISTGKIWLQTSESIIASVNDILQTAYEDALVGSNNLATQDVRDGLAVQIESLLKEMLSLTNTAVDNNYLFGGHITDAAPFTANFLPSGLIQSIDYNGDGGQRNIEVSEGNIETINVVGSNDADNSGTAPSDYGVRAVFRDEDIGVDVFDTLIDLRDDLIAGNTGNIITLRIPELEAAIDNLAVHQSEIGLKLDAITLTSDILSKESIDISEEIDSNEKADLARVVSDINYDQTIYEAALFSTSRLVQGTLFDFIQ
ncbi:MAG: flagellar hook-associated protein 3 [Candidatus Omnitrophica bacterium]|nr:flagellar hook-associated protein 3 [Candidatus Omnitrophota bacterium]